MKTPMNVFNTAMKKKNKNRKGFSLVELIVCLVIMAILAAALVPTLIGYINQTKQSNAKNEAATAVNAVQTIASSAWADPAGVYHNNSGGSDITITYTDGAYTFSNDDVAVVKALAEVKGTISGVTVKNGVVDTLTYADQKGTTTIYYYDAKYNTTAKS